MVDGGFFGSMCLDQSSFIRDSIFWRSRVICLWDWGCITRYSVYLRIYVIVFVKIKIYKSGISCYFDMWIYNFEWLISWYFIFRVILLCWKCKVSFYGISLFILISLLSLSLFPCLSSFFLRVSFFRFVFIKFLCVFSARLFP